LAPFEISIHVAIYVNVFEVPSKGLFDSTEVSAYICALGTGSYTASVVRGEFKCTFVVAAEDDCPFVHLVKLCHHLCQ
jgi:hypothetical protein